MKATVCLENVYVPSEEVVARDVQGEFVIIPITSGVGDFEDEIYTLNKTGKVVWDRLNGKSRLKDVAKTLSAEFSATSEEIEKDVLGFAQELLNRKMLVKVR